MSVGPVTSHLCPGPRSPRDTPVGEMAFWACSIGLVAVSCYLALGSRHGHTPWFPDAHELPAMVLENAVWDVSKKCHEIPAPTLIECHDTKTWVALKQSPTVKLWREGSKKIKATNTPSKYHKEIPNPGCIAPWGKPRRKPKADEGTYCHDRAEGQGKLLTPAQAEEAWNIVEVEG